MAVAAAVSGLVVSGGQSSAVADDPPRSEGASATGAADPGQGDTSESLALAEAKRTGKVVKVLALQDETSDVEAKPDGTLVETMHSKPVRARVGGAWHDIDTSLHAASDGRVAPGAALADVSFSGGGSQPLVRMKKAGKELTLTWPKALPVPVVSGDTAEYRSILPGVDLRMTATDGGFTQLIVVKTAEAAKNPELDQLKLGMSSADLTMRRNADGSLSAVDNAGGGTVFTAPKPMMFDSSPGLTGDSGGATPQQPAKSAKSVKSAMTAAGDATDMSQHAAPVDVTVPADQKSLVLTPDQKLLDAPGTVFPVLIDPNVETPRAGGWAGISRYWGNNSYWKFSGDWGTGYCISGNCAPADVKRVLYSFPIQNQKFVTKKILSAEFGAYETHAYSCTPKGLQLYATSRIGSGTTWNNSSSIGSSSFWTQQLQTISTARGYTNCAAGYAEFGGTTSTAVRDKVQQAANGNWPDLTLGLKAQDETDGDAWKRFSNDAFIRIEYNLAPRQSPMTDLSMSPGGACTTSAVAITRRPQLTARMTDPDGEKIGIQFAAAWVGSDSKFVRRWWSTGGESAVPASNTFKISGSLFSVVLPSAVPLDQVVGWEARAWDGKEWGPWSSAGEAPTDCYFRIDTTAPAGPTVASPSFPGSTDAQAILEPTDGAGRYGTFTLASTSNDVVKYQYNLDQNPSAAHEVPTAGGAPQSVSVLMPSEGPHWISARALDAANNVSETTTYYFHVRHGQQRRAGWTMDTSAGATSLPVSGADTPAKLHGAAAPGATGHSGTAGDAAVTLPGTVAADGSPADYAATDTAVLETDRGFTVSAWVNVADTSKDQAAVSQSGQQQAALGLGLYSGKWTLKLTTADSLTGYGWYTATSDAAPVANRWTHLTGVYDATAKTLTLYVDGKAATPVSGVNVWTSRGALNFGRLLWRGSYVDAWHGSLDDVRVWDRALTAADVTAVAAGNRIGGLGAKAVWSLNDSGTTMSGPAEVDDAVITGGVESGVPGVAGTAARFDGTSGFADTARPQVNATGSFSVSAWVKLAGTPTGDDKVIASQTGQHESQFMLYYSVAQKKWVFGRYGSDATHAAYSAAVQTNCTPATCVTAQPGEWTHVLGVSDAVAHKLYLYVNGRQIADADYTQTTPWAPTGSLRIGGNSREGALNSVFAGDIDDLQVFDRIVTAPEVIDMVQQRPQLVARWKFNDAPANSAPDDLTHPAQLFPGATIDTDTALVGTGALTLDGTGYAATAATPLNTGASFTVAGWAQTAGVPANNMTVFSVGTGTAGAVTVRWQSINTGTKDSPVYTGQWQVETVDKSTPVPVHSTVIHTFSAPEEYGSRWNHLAVTYDAFSNQLALYVNGQLQNEVCDPEAVGPCTDHVSFTTAGQPLTATGGFQFGRNVNTAAPEPFSGQIDDVWAFQGVLSPAQINVLAQGDELDSSTAFH
ncbi:LamG-like jellyroll fold domain-containing protein [Streptomyces sp. NPDC002221]|uniref:LamG-like jellyroll fold domain-containing protein n=1 Tax=Streptomyces sp. NPDC002221 TaxID=3364639 RepID=UPI0036CD0338